MTKMQRLILLSAIVWFAVSLSGIAQAQMSPGSGPMSIYDSKTEITIQGMVEEIKQVTGKRGWSGTHLLVKNETGLWDVHVGPSAYITSQQFSFAKGDQIEVIGSKVTLQGTEVLLAREITKDGKTLVLRDVQGFPKWAGGRRGQR